MADFIFDHQNIELNTFYEEASSRFASMYIADPDRTDIVYLSSPAIEPIATEGGVQAGTIPPVDRSTTNAYHLVAMLYVGQD